jgi:hypothetical protein
MRWRAKHLPGDAGFNGHPLLKDEDALGIAGDQTQIMGDEQNGDAVLSA